MAHNWLTDGMSNKESKWLKPLFSMQKASYFQANATNQVHISSKCLDKSQLGMCIPNVGKWLSYSILCAYNFSEPNLASLEGPSQIYVRHMNWKGTQNSSAGKDFIFVNSLQIFMCQIFHPFPWLYFSIIPLWIWKCHNLSNYPLGKDLSRFMQSYL